MTPVEAETKTPGGAEPPVVEYVLVPVPEALETLPLYVIPSVHASGTEAVLIVTGALITIVLALVAAPPTVSVATKLKLKLPVAVGEPVIVPVVGFSDKPVGRDPPLTEYVFPPVPEPLETLPL